MLGAMISFPARPYLRNPAPNKPERKEIAHNADQKRPLASQASLDWPIEQAERNDSNQVDEELRARFHDT